MSETIAVMNGFGDIMCDPDYEFSLYQDQWGRGCGGPWKGISARLVDCWYEDLADTLMEEIANDENVTSGIDPATWLDLTAAVRCSICGARIDSYGGDW